MRRSGATQIVNDWAGQQIAMASGYQASEIGGSDALAGAASNAASGERLETLRTTATILGWKKCSTVAMLLYTDSQFTSPYAMSVFVALTEKQLSFEVRTLDLAVGANHDAEYARTSLTQRVPTLVDDDFALSESSAIAEYLDDAYPDPPIFPTDLRQRARARQVQAWLRSDFMPIRQERPTPSIFYRPVSEPLSSAAQISSRKLCTAASELLSHGGENLFGQWSIADVDLALMLNRLILNGDQIPTDLIRYATAQWERASIQEWVRRERPPL